MIGLSAGAADYRDARDQAYLDAMVISTIRGDASACAVIGSQVSDIMVKRLNGQAMSGQMAEPNLAFFHFVIRDAYKQPFYQSVEMKKALVRDFRERYEVECYDVLGASG
jgi:hypothetical protein